MTLPGMKKPLKPIPVFQQMPGEKKKQFFRRMDNTVKVWEGIKDPSGMSCVLDIPSIITF